MTPVGIDWKGHNYYKSRIPHKEVSTVLSLDYGWETMVFSKRSGKALEQYTRHYPNEAEAIKGHAETVRSLSGQKGATA